MFKCCVTCCVVILCFASSCRLNSNGQKKETPLTPGGFIAKQNDWTAENFKGKVKSTLDSDYLTQSTSAIDGKERLNGIMTMDFDERGFLTSRNADDNAGPLDNAKMEKFKYQFDSKLNKIAREEYDSHNSAVEKITFSYNNKGDLIEEEIYSPLGKLSEKTQYFYDTLGHVIHNAGGADNDNDVGGSPHDTYDINGNISTKYFGVGYAYHKLYSYDDRNNIIQTAGYQGELLISTTIFSYTYDTTGNWTKKVEYDQLSSGSKKLKRIIERKITYYL